MRPLSLFESGDSSGEASLSALLETQSIKTSFMPEDDGMLARLCVRGGWPENIDAPPEKADRMPFQYLQALYASDISGVDNIRRDPRKVEALVRALARNNATTVSNKALKWDVTEGLGSISAPTLASYVSALKRVFILEEVPGWVPDARARPRVRVSPKRHLVDPSLVVASLMGSVDSLLADRPTFGMVFEGLCLRDLRIYGEQMDARVLHYHDESGLEVDAIIERRNGSYAVIEIKLSSSQVDGAASSLKGFVRKMRKQGRRLPSLLLVITGGGQAQQREDGIIVAPITSLKD
jgi:predicted AAA+ superfamily ATPase